ncbi:PD-(D/E)XK nuclease superfamily protein [Vibrio rotiferianus]|uniref:PD-(D/E)XK nuclease superfamily protein n=1 Tax=Vibrio rotiferianus TaxID=190895 RepID=UPI00406A7008
MSRKDLLVEVSNCIEKLGFVSSSSCAPFTFQSNVKYASTLLPEKNDYAHFILYTLKGSLQVAVKFQETNGTAIEKLAYTVMDAANSEHEEYLVVCGGSELLKHNRAVDFLNSKKYLAPKLLALTAEELEAHLRGYIGPLAA